MDDSPLYSIHDYGSGVFKVVSFKRRSDLSVVCLRDREEQRSNDSKLLNNISRARSMVLQYALCNPWQYFFTGTLDPARWDRRDLDRFINDFSQKIRDWRKDYYSKLDVLLVPEMHQDGAWHVHGFLNNLPLWCLGNFYWLPLPKEWHMTPYPYKLCGGNFYNWYDFSDRYGFCSVAPIRDPVGAAYYIVKYISKDIGERRSDLGKHLYFHSRPLKSAVKASDVYFPNLHLDACCVNDYDFCKTGMVYEQPWYFPYVWDGADYPCDPLPSFQILEPSPEFSPGDIDPYYEQLKMAGWSNGRTLV